MGAHLLPVHFLDLLSTYDFPAAAPGLLPGWDLLMTESVFPRPLTLPALNTAYLGTFSGVPK